MSPHSYQRVTMLLVGRRYFRFLISLPSNTQSPGAQDDLCRGLLNLLKFQLTFLNHHAVGHKLFTYEHRYTITYPLSLVAHETPPLLPHSLIPPHILPIR